MKKIFIIFFFLLITHFMFCETVEELEGQFKSIMDNGRVSDIKSLIGLEISGDFRSFINHIGSFMVGDVDSDLSGYHKDYEDFYVLVMTKTIDNGVKRLVDIVIIPKLENEYLRNQSGFIGDENVDFLTVITSEDTPFTQETINTYRLVYYFDCDSESIVDVTDRELIVYND